MTKEEFFEKAKLVNRYKVIKKLDGELSYAEIGSVYHSDILYDRGYNILQLVVDGFLEVVERIFPFEKDIAGKNRHSVLTVCPECGSHGVNMPLEKQCGNCNYTETRTYYDAWTIHEYLQSIAASTPQSSTSEEAIGERKFTLKEALEIITSAMAEDKSEGSCYYSWQANIAMAFKDEFDRQHAARKDFTRWLFIENGLHEIANNAAKNFLNILIQRIP